LIDPLLEPFTRDAPPDVLAKSKLAAIDECLRPRTLKEAALIIIDMQKGFLYVGAALEVPEGRTKCLPNVGRLLSKAREVGLQVVFTKYVHRPGSQRISAYPFAPEVFAHPPGTPSGLFHPSNCCMQGDPSVDIVDELAVTKDDIVIEKYGYDSFHETTLDTELRSRGIGHLYITGVTTDICVDSTVKRGFHLEYKITAASDAVLTKWPNIQEACLDIWKRKFARVKSTSEILDEMDALKRG